MDDGPLDGLVESNDRHLGRIDDRRRRYASELAETGHRDGRPDQFIASRLVAARALGETPDGGRDLPESQGLGIAHQRNLETVRRLRGDADMHRTMPYQDAALRVVQHVALRKRFEHPR